MQPKLTKLHFNLFFKRVIMKKKSMLNRLKNLYFNQLLFAKQSGFGAVIIPVNCDSEPYYLEEINDEEYIYEVAEQSGWSKFAVINFTKNVEGLFDLYDVA